jgi:hypothetical protein
MSRRGYHKSWYSQKQLNDGKIQHRIGISSGAQRHAENFIPAVKEIMSKFHPDEHVYVHLEGLRFPEEEHIQKLSSRLKPEHLEMLRNGNLRLTGREDIDRFTGASQKVGREPEEASPVPTSDEILRKMGKKPSGVPSSIWKGYGMQSDSYFPIKTFKEYLFEQNRPVESKRERYSKFLSILRTPEFADHDARMDNGIWNMIGHDAKDIESVKRRVFGNNLSKQKPEIFWYHSTKGIITHPTNKNLTHDTIERDLVFGPSLVPSLRKIVDPDIASKIGSLKNIVGRGRVEHRDDGTGIITYAHVGGAPQSAAIRTLERRHPNYMIIDPYGKML